MESVFLIPKAQRLKKSGPLPDGRDSEIASTSGGGGTAPSVGNDKATADVLDALGLNNTHLGESGASFDAVSFCLKSHKMEAMLRSQIFEMERTG